jgi:hypothetical protein
MPCSNVGQDKVLFALIALNSTYIIQLPMYCKVFVANDRLVLKNLRAQYMKTGWIHFSIVLHPSFDCSAYDPSPWHPLPVLLSITWHVWQLCLRSREQYAAFDRILTAFWPRFDQFWPYSTGFDSAAFDVKSRHSTNQTLSKKKAWAPFTLNRFS